MASSPLTLVIEQLRRFVLARDTDVLSDQKLLELFVRSRNEPAFEAIVRRHGAMVMSVCQRVLRKHHDAEDAFQATFLVLARKAASISTREALAHWLYSVAFRAALKSKDAIATRRTREREGTQMARPMATSPKDRGDLDALLDHELNRLPEKYRVPIVLCDLQGKTRKEAAQQLGCPGSTVTTRLTRARALLAKRLAQRGVTLSAAALAGQESLAVASASVPPSLSITTSQAALIYAAGQGLTDVVSFKAAAVAAGVLQSMFLTKLKTIALAAVLISLTTFGGSGLVVLPAAPAQMAEERGPVVTTKPRPPLIEANKTANDSNAKNEPILTDAFGDPLPRHALVRLGTERLRHGFNVRNLGFTADGQMLLSSDEQNIRIWDVATGKRLRQFGDSGYFTSFAHIATSADNRMVALSLKSGEIEIWDAASGIMVRKLKSSKDPNHLEYAPHGVQMSPDGQVVAAYNWNAQKDGDKQPLRLYDVVSGVERHRLSLHTISRFVFTSDNKTLVTSNDEKTIRFWDVMTGQQTRQVEISETIADFILSPDMRLLAAPTARMELQPSKRIVPKRIAFWDLQTGKELHRTAEHNYAANLERFSPDGKIFVSTDGGTNLHWWDVATGKELTERRPRVARPGTIAFSPDGKTLAVNSSHARIELWDLTTGQPKHSTDGLQASVNSTAASPDGRFFATADGDGMIRLWDSASGGPIRVINTHSLGMRSLRFSPNSQHIVATCMFRPVVILGVDNYVNTVQVWNCATGQEVHRFPGSQFALSPDGKSLATGTKDKVIYIWDFATGQERFKWAAHELADRTLTFSPDGRSVRYVTTHKQVFNTDIAAGKTLQQFAGPTDAAAFSPDGKLVAFNIPGGETATIALHEMNTGNKIDVLQARSTSKYPSYSFNGLTFSADSRMLAGTRSREDTIYVWDIPARQEFQRFVGHKQPISDLAFSVDGRLLSGGNDATGLIWDINGQHAKQNANPVSDEMLEKYWADLGSDDAQRGQVAVGALAAHWPQARALCQKQFRPISAADAKVLERLLAQLDDDSFKERAAGERALEQLGYSAEIALRQTLQKSPSIEARGRIEKLLARLDNDPERLRHVRILQLLEQCGAPEAREILQSVAGGAVGVWLTTEARAALERLEKRPVKTP